ncbi:hypothetical protein PROFUN_01682 [Planoprotostelium fungivorum]|uniref:PIPK domain-containing protein n=1 Tax=Planoprotostelium fungivorum TaxID=1890364 RepID=A0A2P6MWE3_9EUKA|nr:hypothetical protein PROFUN_01682 [Planoprotostelium fungivorum]
MSGKEEVETPDVTSTDKSPPHLSEESSKNDIAEKKKLKAKMSRLSTTIVREESKNKLDDGSVSPSTRRLRRRPTERGQSFIESEDEARQRARAKSKPKPVLEHKRNVFGESIYKKHPGWILMQNIQTGLRQSVGKSGELSFLDERTKLSENLSRHEKFFSTPPELPFPPEGSTLTQPHKTGLFKFKNYCPLVFGHLREKFGVDPGDYMVSLCNTIDEQGTNSLRMLPTPGKSGSLFFFSEDMKYIIKTIPKDEAKLLRYLLPYYYTHVMSHTHTLLPRFYGLHRVKPHRGSQVRFLIMGNVFQTNKKIHERYDLKGSTFGRAVTEEEVKVQKENVTYKDVDWRAKNMTISLPRDTADLFIKQLESDCQFLRSRNIMDYSLLIGIHDCNKNPKEDCTFGCELKRKNPHYARPTVEEKEEVIAAANIVVESGNVTPLLSPETPRTEGLLSPAMIPRAETSSPAPEKDDGSSGSSAESPGKLEGMSSNVEPPKASPLDHPRSATTSLVTSPSKPLQSATLRREAKTLHPTESASLGGPDDGTRLTRTRSDGSVHTTRSAPSGSNGNGFNLLKPGTYIHRKKSGVEEQIIETGGFVNNSLRRVPNENETKRIIAQTNYPLPESFLNRDGGCIFTRDDGGMTGYHSNVTYFIGIIDILMLYSIRKKMEHSYKSFRYSSDEISSVNPKDYANRFLNFIHDVVPIMEEEASTEE